MSEKRFNDAKGYVYDGKKCIGIINDDYTCENIINLLNAFHEENKQFKEQEKRLYKYFRKCFDDVSEQGFRETWEVVKKYD